MGKTKILNGHYHHLQSPSLDHQKDDEPIGASLPLDWLRGGRLALSMLLVLLPHCYFPMQKKTIQKRHQGLGYSFVQQRLRIPCSTCTFSPDDRKKKFLQNRGLQKPSKKQGQNQLRDRFVLAADID